MSISRMDWDVIDSRIRRNLTDKLSDTKVSIAFLKCVLEHYFPSLFDEIDEAITDGPNDRGIDAIHIVESEEAAEVFIFQSKYRISYKTTNKTINENEVLKVKHFLEELFHKSSGLSETPNFRLKEAITRIWGLHKEGKICRYRIVFCTNGLGLSHSAEEIMKSLLRDYTPVSYEFYGPDSFVRDLSSAGKIHEIGQLQVVGKEILERTDGDVRGVVASVDARSFIQLISVGEGMSIKRHLFDDNLRVFLGSQGGYNPSIIATASSPDSYLFWYLNNGITITCKSFSYNKGHVNPTLRLENFQIVNGAQTSHSLIEAYRQSPNEFENVVVMVRVYATEREDIAERVAVTTNSQAKILRRDLRANHPTLKKLELALKERGFYFERKRNMHSIKPLPKRIDALKLGQIVLSYYLLEPDKAKSESDSIFDSRFNSVFHEKYDVDELLKIFHIYQLIEQHRDRYNNEFGTSPESDDNRRYLIYGHWFALYACRLILIKRGNPTPPTGNKADELVSEAISLIATACEQQKAVAHYQMFRSPRTRDKIMSELNGKQGNFFDLLIESTGNG